MLTTVSLLLPDPVYSSLRTVPSQGRCSLHIWISYMNVALQLFVPAGFRPPTMLDNSVFCFSLKPLSHLSFLLWPNIPKAESVFTAQTLSCHIYFSLNCSLSSRYSIFLKLFPLMLPATPNGSIQWPLLGSHSLEFLNNTACLLPCPLTHSSFLSFEDRPPSKTLSYFIRHPQFHLH